MKLDSPEATVLILEMCLDGCYAIDMAGKLGVADMVRVRKKRADMKNVGLIEKVSGSTLDSIYRTTELGKALLSEYKQRVS